MVDHVHFHVIPKPTASDEEGLVVGWPAKATPKDELTKFYEELKGKL
jgi:diadenosine tetraphosphate (Ap4A) HIT family hydrolase